MDDDSNIVRYREDGANYIVSEDSQFRDLEIGLSSIRKFRARKRVEMRYPRADIDFIKDRLNVVHESRGVIIHVRGNNI